MLTIRDNVLWDTNAKEKWRNPRPATVNWVSNASRAVPKTTDVDLANIIFLATTATSLPTVSLQRCAEKGKLALHGAKEVVTTPYPVNSLTVLWKIKWLSLKSKNVFVLKGQYHLTYFIGPCFTLIYRKSIKILLIYKLEWKKTDTSWFVWNAWIVFDCTELRIIGDFVDSVPENFILFCYPVLPMNKNE